MIQNDSHRMESRVQPKPHYVPVDDNGTLWYAQDVSEQCPACGEENRHQVSVEVPTENPRTENAAFSRELYRIAECQTCGKTTTKRMNNAR